MSRTATDEQGLSRSRVAACKELRVYSLRNTSRHGSSAQEFQSHVDYVAGATSTLKTKSRAWESRSSATPTPARTSGSGPVEEHRADQGIHPRWGSQPGTYPYHGPSRESCEDRRPRRLPPAEAEGAPSRDLVHQDVEAIQKPGLLWWGRWDLDLNGYKSRLQKEIVTLLLH